MFDPMSVWLHEMPEQLRGSMCLSIDLPPQYHHVKYNAVLICAMGGSAIGGDILSTAAAQQAPCPLLVHRSYGLPAWADADTLVCAVSYSGNTEETLSAYHAAVERGCLRVVISSGGELTRLAQKNGDALISVPGSLMPRAALGWLFASLALALEEIGLLCGMRKDIRATAEMLEEMRPELVPENEVRYNPARALARSLQGQLPLIWGCTGTTEAVARRWKAQFNENAKIPAWHNTLPELDHNEIMGFDLPEEILQRIVLILLRDPDDPPRLQKRMDITRALVESRIHSVVEVPARGHDPLSRLFSLIYLGDYASYYLAKGYGLDPVVIPRIDALKSAMTAGEQGEA
ncbi:MAG: bifunctional phosphoglucose/phosphomannose isomerase [Syntrophomonadaceae bacterium]|nr:bifunctional phosphoglucose/phosphomannose isomerase [Syntrophomonadaceae bacterium]